MKQGPATVSPQELEHRRYKRHPVNLKGTLKFTDMCSLMCEIRDFCEGGLFLKPTLNSVDNANLSGLKNQVVEIEISVPSRGKKQNFHATVNVVRVTAGGIGVAFEKVPPETAMLEALFATTATNKNHSSNAITSGHFSAENTEQLKKHCIKIISDSIRQILEQFFKNVEGALCDAANHSTSDAQSNSFLDAIPLLNSHRTNLEKLVCSTVIDRFNGNYQAASAELNREHREISQDDLSLIDLEEFDDWLNISDVINNSRSLFERELMELRQKISFLTDSTIDDATNPVAPDYICEIFRDGIESHGFDSTVRKSVYKVFESALISNLGELYRPLIQLMAEIPSDNRLTTKPHAMDAHKTVSPSQPTDSLIPPSKPTMASDNRLTTKPHAMDAHKTVSPSQPTDSLLPPSIPTMASQNSLQNYQSLSESAAAMHPWPMPHLPKEHNGLNFTTIANKLVDLTNQTGMSSALQTQQCMTSQAIRPGTTASGLIGDYSAEQILNALSMLRQTIPSNGEIAQDGRTLEFHVLEVLAKGSSHTDIANPEDQNSVKVAGKFFDCVNAETYRSPGMEATMQKIQLALLDLAFKDGRFLDSKDHPARNILNLLDRISVAANDKGEILDKSQQATVQAVLEQFANNTQQDKEVFVRLGKQLEKVGQPIEKNRLQNIRRVRKACETKQKNQRSTLKVEKLIDSRIAGKNVPKVIVSLLDAGWKQLLILYDIKEGADSDSRSKGIAVIDKLLQWKEEDATLEELNDPEFQEVLNFVDTELSSVCASIHLHYRIMEELTAYVIGEGDPKARKKPEMIIVPAQRPGEKTVEENSIKPRLREWLHQVKQLKVGDWLLFLFKDGENEPLNLMWIGELPNNYVFVDRKGLKKFDLDSHELAERMSNGLAMKIESLDVPLTDRVTNHILQDMHDKLIYHSTRDQQTGLINRKEFIKLLEYELANVKQYQSIHALCYMEIDQIMLVSKTCNFEAGMVLLNQLVELINSELTDEYILSRMGDEAFGVLLKNTSGKNAAKIAERLRTSIGSFEFNWENKNYSLGVSIGLAELTELSDSVTSVLKNADTAYLTAKRTGGNRIQIYREDDEQLKFQADVFQWAGRIGKVLSENRIVLRCQLISSVSRKNSSHSHYEVLLSVKDEQGKIIPPDGFIPSAEHCNRMSDVDKWIVQNVMKWTENHRDKFEQIGGFAINLSGQSVNSKEFLEFLKQELSMRDIPVEKFTFEITETSAVHNLSLAQKFITQIKRYGCKFSLDDFGSGFSSYSYLKNLDVDYLKIDGMFVKDLATNPTDFVMVKSMNEIGHSLGMKTIAEYVENKEILKKLNEIGVDYAQGFGIEKPFLLSELT